jgi:uncharacterized protein (TIGR00251 family)
VSHHVTLRLRVLPGARRNEIAGWYGDAVKVRCQAPALDGRANDAVTEFLADRIGLRRSDVVLIQGLRSRDKVVEIRGLTAGELYARLGVPAPAAGP